jgi:16S rRNA (guanine966-N2)-methyltransferase
VQSRAGAPREYDACGRGALMRIIGGRHRGRALAGLGAGDPKAHLRPTSDRVRESIFNLLAHGGYRDPPPPEDCLVLDLFAGTGALGLEALSRGAEAVTFVERGRPALRLLGENIARLGAGGEACVLARDALRLGPHSGRGFDLVFVDPPYARALGETALAGALGNGWIAPGALIVWEEARDVSPPDGLARLDARRYGETLVHVFRNDADELPLPSGNRSSEQ